ncbi:MAG: aldehyde dehydrogenase family protein [Microbacterium ginsengisoli]|jgi:phenylacetic acid degradation protein paaN|nr:aldehyde dehydrogenase family protein [Microbacterium ginsengisoli]
MTMMHTATRAAELVARHEAQLNAAVVAYLNRTAYSAFSGREPSGRGSEEAEAAFGRLLGSPVELADHAGTVVSQGDEISPWTGEPLGVSYPHAEPDELVERARRAQGEWTATLDERVATSIEMIERLFAENRLLGLAAMHTTGQGRGMSQSGSGTNALDRGLEAVAAAWQSISRVPESAIWEQSFGAETVSLEKRYRAAPLGPALVVACASFPAWNVYPAVFANLVTGNPVIVKPHPTSVLQMALAVAILRSTLIDLGHPRDLVQLAVDTVASPITSELATHPGIRVIDFTGSARYGAWIEQNARQARVYTETSGINSVVLDGFTDPDADVRAIAGAVSLFSAQMCTAPQNVYVPEDGVAVPGGRLTAEQVEAAIVAAVAEVSATPRRAAAVLGTIQSEATIAELAELTARMKESGQVLSAPRRWEAPGYPAARTTTPLIARATLDQRELFDHECFGPAVFLIRVPDARTGLARAAGDAAEHGAITAFLYSADEVLIADAEDAFAAAGAALTINVTGAMPINFSAAFSDFHVSGLNPAGTATLTDDSFVAGRFRVVQSRRPLRKTQA